MDIIKELESLNFDASLYTEKSIKDCVHDEKVCIIGTLNLVEKKTRAGAPYYQVTIKDSTGNIGYMAWNNTPVFKFIDMTDDKKLVRVYGVANIDKYKNIDIKQLQFIEKEEEEKEEAVSITNLKSLLDGRIATIINEPISILVRNALDIVGDKLETTPFTEKTAYNYEGGLLQQIVDALDIASGIVDSFNCGNNKNSTILNEDMLIAGVILANLGKTRTLTTENGIPVKTFEGSLDEDAIYSREIATKAVDITMEALSEEDRETYDKIFKEILHMVASAKGNKAYGAISTPRSKHAIILSDINNIVYTKGLFETLESTNAQNDFSKAYDNGKNYFLGNYE